MYIAAELEFVFDLSLQKHDETRVGRSKMLDGRDVISVFRSCRTECLDMLLEHITVSVFLYCRGCREQSFVSPLT